MSDNAISIARPIDEVWGYVADVRRVPEWQEDLREMRLDGAFETGTTGSETRKIGRRYQTMRFRLIKVDPPHGFTFETLSGALRPAGGMALTAEGDGTRVRFQMDMNPQWYLKPVGRMVDRQVQKQQRLHLERLKEILEAGADA